MNIKKITNGKTLWLFLFILSTMGISTALIAEHYFNMLPCYLCIYQRIALLIIAFSSLLTLIRSKNHIFRKFGYLGWFTGTSIGLYSSIKLVYIQSKPPQISFCSMGANQLIETFGWLEALPMLFNPSGDCSASSGSFLNITFEQWSLGLFLLYTFAFIFIISKRVIERLNS